MSNEKEMLSYSLRTKKLDVAAVEKMLKEVEEEEGVSSNYKVEPGEETKFFPGFTPIVIGIGKEFAGLIVKKYGGTFLKWLEKKLGVDEEEGEQLKEKKKPPTDTQA